MHDTSSGLPTRSMEGANALDLFYVGFNEVNFYFEDQDQENLYEEIIKKLFPELNFFRVFPLHGKPSVITHAKQSKKNNDIKNPIYIVDKDFDDLLGTIINDDRIFYLDRYCIENYLLDEDALIKVLIETYPKEKKDELKKNIDLPSFYAESMGSLRPLFKLFYSVQKLGLGLKNCSLKPEEFTLKGKPWSIDPTKIEKYLELLKTTTQNKNLNPPLDDPLNDIRTKICDTIPSESLVSGKFIAAIMFHYIKSKYSLGAISFESFIYRTAKNHDYSNLNLIAQKVRTHLYMKHSQVQYP